MSDAHHETPGEPGAVRHEARDVELRAVVRVGLLVGVVTLVTAGVTLGLLQLLAGREARRDPAPLPVAERRADRQPPEPRLQESPTLDVRQLREEERHILTSYGWVDRQAGVVRLPIERALELLVERGLPRVPGRPVNAPAGPAQGTPQ